MHQTRRKYLGLAFIAPALLFVAAFTLYPFGELIWMSLHKWSLLGGKTYDDVQNYVRAWDDDFFWNALVFTLKYTVYITPIIIGLAFALALLTAGNSPLRRLTRATIFLPVVIGLSSSSLLWFWLFDQQVGLLNRALIDLGIINAPLVWFGDDELALWAVIISVVWKVVGFSMILFIASMQAIPGELTEAARVDGASYLQRVWHVVLPLSRRMIALATLIAVIGSMLAFDQFYIMTQGGPMNATITSVHWIYTNSFTYFKLGYGAALSVILTLMICIGAAVQIALVRGGREAAP